MLVKKENLDGPFAHREAFHYGRLVSVFVKLELEKRGHRLVLYMTCCSVTILTVRLIWSFWLAMLEGGVYTRDCVALCWSELTSGIVVCSLLGPIGLWYSETNSVDLRCSSLVGKH